MEARSVDDFKQNAAIIFDYHSPTDFKFASMHPRPNKWQLGQRDADGWHVLTEAVVEAGIQIGTAIDAAIEIDGSTVVFWTEAVSMSYDFGTTLAAGSGQMGSGQMGSQRP